MRLALAQYWYGQKGITVQYVLSRERYMYSMLPEVRRLVGVRRLQLGHQDPEDVQEEAEVGQDAHQAY